MATPKVATVICAASVMRVMVDAQRSISSAECHILFFASRVHGAAFDLPSVRPALSLREWLRDVCAPALFMLIRLTPQRSLVQRTRAHALRRYARQCLTSRRA